MKNDLPIEKNFPMYKKLFNDISDVFSNTDITPRDALIILGVMNESMYKMLVQDPDVFNNSNIKEIMGKIKEDK